MIPDKDEPPFVTGYFCPEQQGLSAHLRPFIRKEHVSVALRDGSGTSSYERSYKYSYDGLDRYTASTYAERTTSGTGSFSNNVNGFDEHDITYDANGNILTLKRNSSTQGTNSNIEVDNLSYTYDSANPNRLYTVTDGSGSNYTGYGFRNITGTSTGNYTYDVNGNMTADPYKGLSLTYNDINRTDRITVTSGQYIDYTYDAGGILLRKQQYSSSTLQKTTDYVEGFVYEDGTLSYFAMPEGRVRNVSGTLKQEFIISDQQGNARVSFEDNGSGAAIVKQENSYYGYGLALANSPVATPTLPNKNLYNGGSEWQNDYGDLPDLMQTFYRNYDAALGRFVGVDPKAEATESLSSFQYGNNNPISFNDPLGDNVWIGNGAQLSGYTGQNADPFILAKNSGAFQNYWRYGPFGNQDETPRDEHTDGTDDGGGGGPEGSAEGYNIPVTQFVQMLTDVRKGINIKIRLNTETNSWYSTENTAEYSNWGNMRGGVTVTDYGVLTPTTVTFNGNSANQGGSSSDKPFDWYGNYGKANAFVGTEVFLADQAQAAGRFELAVTQVKAVKGLGIATVAFGTAMDFKGMLNYYHPTAANVDSRVSPGKFGTNVGVNALGIWGGPPGAAFSLLYFGIDAYYPHGTFGFATDVGQSLQNSGSPIMFQP